MSRLFVRFFRFFLFPTIAFTGSVAHGQSTTGQATVGIQKFGAYDGFPDTIDVGSLGLHLEIPLWSKAGRGRGTDWTIVLTNYSQNVPNPPCYQTSDGAYHCEHYGPSVAPAMLSTGNLIPKSTTRPCSSIQGAGTYTDTSYRYMDGRGNTHTFPGYSQSVQDQNNTCSSFSQYGLTARDSEEGGYLINVPTPPSTSPITITTPSGTVYSKFGTYGASVLTDSNGNTVSVSPSLCTGGDIPCLLADTLNTTSVQVSGGTFATNYQSRQPILVSYLDDTGASRTISLNYKLYTLANSAPTDGLLLDNVTYPDGSAYRFTYLQNATGAVLGSPDGTIPILLSGITLPSGGTISYSYGWATLSCGSNPSWTYQNSLTRSTSDGTTTYARTLGVCGGPSSTQITKPNGDETFVYVVGVSAWTYETKRVIYDHSNLSIPVRTIMRCYNGATGDCTTTLVTQPVTQLAITTTLDNGISSKVVRQYSGTLPTEIDEYDYSASTPTRKTITSYAPLGNNISDRPSSIIVYDSLGNVAKKTTYSYDEATPSPMTLPGHMTVSGSRGNATSAYEWIVSSNQSLRTQYTYDDAGQITAVTDPKLYTTSYGYDAATDAYLTKITRPPTNGVAYVSTFGYGPNSGRVTNAYDENNQLTQYSYDLMFRPSSTTTPDSGQTTFSYTPDSRTTNMLQQSVIWHTTVEQYDGYGRIAQTQVTDTPSPTYIVTTYDSLGRVFNVYNNTRCNPPTTNCGESTWGFTSYQYDALNRTKQITKPDGNKVVMSYLGRATQVQDEGNGSQPITRISQTDALGRVRSVCEVASGPFVGSGGSSSSSLIGSGGTPAACGLDYSGTGFLTTYNYDGLNNLTQVNQPGVGQRQFYYDSLSRLTSAVNPESGTTGYSYDANNNLITKTDARGIVTCFGVWSSGTCNTTTGYDALNRVSNKTYSDGTPGVAYTYDVSVGSLSITYPVGRLVKVSTTDNKTATINSYDQMGRVKNQWQCTPQNCGSGYFSLPYNYDLMGNITSAGDGMGVTLTYGFGTDGSAALRTITSSLSDANHPSNLLAKATYTPYGGFTGATLGNSLIDSRTYNNRWWPLSISAATTSATSGTGSVTVGGSEQSIPGTYATGWVTITGAERKYTVTNPCPPAEKPCPTTTYYDSGTITLYVNGVQAQITYGQTDTLSTLVSRMAATINTASGYPVTASASNSTINLTAKVWGQNYSLSATSVSTSPYTQWFSGTSFPVSTSGSTLTGGTNAIYDQGSITVNVNGTPSSYSYGQNDTPTTIASGLANSLASSPWVTATASGGVLNLTAKGSGFQTNYPLSTSVSYDTTHFSRSSFTAAVSGPTLTGGSGTAYGVSLSSYAPNGNILAANDSANGNWTYTYDPFNRLVGANQNSGQAVFSYVYDIAGNRWQQNGPNTMALSFTGNNSTNNNRADGYSYDAAGNLLNDGTYCYTYDAENRLTQVSLPSCLGGAVVASYVYDADGNRVRKTTSAGSVDFLYDLAGNQVTEVSSTGTRNRSEVYAGNRHIATYNSASTYFIHADWIGTERVRSNISGAPCETITSLTFGDVLSTSGSCSDVSPMHFTGQEHDFESGLDNFLARHLTSRWGRFISPDPDNASARLTTPQSWNAYSYVFNNPSKYVDPSGLDCIYFTDDGPHGGWIKPGDCVSDTDNGYYVDGSINGAVYNTTMDLTNVGITFDNENNWMTYRFTPNDSPFPSMVGGQCVGDCPNQAAIVAGAASGAPSMRADTGLLTPFARSLLRPPEQPLTVSQLRQIQGCMALMDPELAGPMITSSAPTPPTDSTKETEGQKAAQVASRGTPQTYRNGKPITPNIAGSKRAAPVVAGVGAIAMLAGVGTCAQNAASQ